MYVGARCVCVWQFVLHQILLVISSTALALLSFVAAALQLAPDPSSSSLLCSYIIIIIIRVQHVQKYTMAILPHAALCHSAKGHSITNNQVW